MIAGVAAIVATSSYDPSEHGVDLLPGTSRVLKITVQSEDKPEEVELHFDLVFYALPDAPGGQLVGFISDTEPPPEALASLKEGSFGAGQDAGALGRVAFVLPVPPQRNPERFDGKAGGFEVLRKGSGTSYLTLFANATQLGVALQPDLPSMRQACGCKPAVSIEQVTRDAGP